MASRLVQRTRFGESLSAFFGSWKRKILDLPTHPVTGIIKVYTNFVLKIWKSCGDENQHAKPHQRSLVYRIQRRREGSSWWVASLLGFCVDFGSHDLHKIKQNSNGFPGFLQNFSSAFHHFQIWEGHSFRRWYTHLFRIFSYHKRTRRISLSKQHTFDSTAR